MAVDQILGRRRGLPSIPWLVMVAGATVVGFASARYLLGGAAMAPLPLKPNLLDHPAAFYVHIAAASVALLIGPYQFLKRFRVRGAKVHRAMGCVYAGAVAIGGAAAFVIAPGSNGGPVAAAGFLTLAVLWWSTTGAAVAAILRGDRVAHRRWMYRSYALTLAGVTLRPLPARCDSRAVRVHRRLCRHRLAVLGPQSGGRRSAVCPLVRRADPRLTPSEFRF